MDEQEDTVEVFRDNAGEWRWHRQAANGRIVAASGEGFQDRGYAIESAQQYNPGEIILRIEPQ